MNHSIPDLPRQMLWSDKKTMDEFFILDPINEAFYEVFVTLREKPFDVQISEVKVFNEVYYQLTRMLYENPMPDDLTKYINDIKANMGWNYSAELVMSMVFFLYLLIDNKECHLNKYYKEAFSMRFFECQYWGPFNHCYEKLVKDNRHVKYRFYPRPSAVKYFKENYVNWKDITQNYNLTCIDNVIKLWSNIDDKREVAHLINDSIYNTPTYMNAAEIAHIRHFMEVYLIADDNAKIWRSAEESPWEECKRLKDLLEKTEKEKNAFQQHITELEADNKRLNALLEKKKRNGTARKFTLVEIVKYCKGCVEWADVKSIVAMLNKLLMRIATDEDSDLVDSIEKEFLNRKYGDNIMGDKNVFKDNSGLNRISLPPGMTPQEAIVITK